MVRTKQLCSTVRRKGKRQITGNDEVAETDGRMMKFDKKTHLQSP